MLKSINIPHNVFRTNYKKYISYLTYKKVKVKCTLVQAFRLCTGRTVHSGSRCIALLFPDHGTRRGEGSKSHPGRSLPPRKTRYPLYRGLRGPQGRSGQVWKFSPLTGIRSTDRPASSQSPYPMSYRALSHVYYIKCYVYVI